VEYRDIGYYDDRATGRLSIDRGSIKAAFGSRVTQVRVEAIEDAIILTDPSEPAWTMRDS